MVIDVTSRRILHPSRNNSPAFSSSLQTLNGQKFCVTHGGLITLMLTMDHILLSGYIPHPEPGATPTVTMRHSEPPCPAAIYFSGEKSEEALNTLPAAHFLITSKFRHCLVTLKSAVSRCVSSCHVVVMTPTSAWHMSDCRVVSMQWSTLSSVSSSRLYAQLSSSPQWRKVLVLRFTLPSASIRAWRCIWNAPFSAC